MVALSAGNTSTNGFKNFTSLEYSCFEGLPGVSGNRGASPNTAREQGNRKKYFKEAGEQEIKFLLTEKHVTDFIYRLFE